MPGLLVHEWIADAGGSENVLREFANAFPDAEVLALWNDAKDRFPGVQETWLARSPFRRTKAVALPLMPPTWRNVKPSSVPEWILVSSHLFAHHVHLRGAPGVPKFVYTHTPARYIWEPELDRRGSGIAARTAATILKPLDRHRAAEATSIATNSEFTRRRVSAAWNRDARVIYPPVAVDEIQSIEDWTSVVDAGELARLNALPATFLLGASRFVSYKQLELVIAAGEAVDLPVVLAGSGPDGPRLRGIAEGSKTRVDFVDRPSDPMLRALYQRALAFIFPAIEDFGIMPVEAMAAGTPVVAQATGGAAESVAIAGGGAVVFDPTTPDEWRRAVTAATLVDRAAMADAVQRFSRARFRAEIRAWVTASRVGVT